MQTHFIIMAGAAGFLAAAAVCLATGKPLGTSLVSATIATLAFAVVGRWWARMLLFSLQRAKVEQAAGAASQAVEPTEETPEPKTKKVPGAGPPPSTEEKAN